MSVEDAYCEIRAFFFLSNYNSSTVSVTGSHVAFSSYLNFTFWDEKAKEKNSTQMQNSWWE